MKHLGAIYFYSKGRDISRVKSESPKMEKSETSNQLELFLRSGIYRFERSNTVFLDPVRVLNRSYTHHRVSPSAYYSRFFQSNAAVQGVAPAVVSLSRKRKRKVKCKMNRILNDREQIAERRHQDVRPLLLMAHEALLGATDLLATIRNLRSGFDDLYSPRAEQSFVEPARVGQSPLYESHYDPKEEIGVHLSEERVIPLFCNLVVNDMSNDVEASVQDDKYVLPRKSCFYMSDLRKIHNLIPAESDCGFNLILIDPPWENGSARQKLMYPTLPNRYFLSLPVKHLTHAEGALIALWITNREKLRSFIENELFPSWGVKHIATYYWLKVKPDSSLIGDLDLFHHRPYECLLVGYHQREGVDSNWLSRVRQIPNNQIIITIPGDYSRKPPIGELLLEYVPGSRPVRSIELFAREMIAGWTSWGNEPLHFQESRYFLKTT